MSHFNEVANEWDSPQKTQFMEILAKKSIEVLNLSQNQKLNILDFGCGTGLFGLGFFDYAKGITGVDTSEGMLDVFKKKAENVSNINLLQLDLTTDPLDQKFDLIVSSMVFHHLDHPKKMLVTLSKMLCKGGKIAIVDLDEEDGSFHPDPKKMGVKHFGFSKKKLEFWANELEAGFEHTIINKIEKNDQTYGQFLAVFS